MFDVNRGHISSMRAVTVVTDQTQSK